MTEVQAIEDKLKKIYNHGGTEVFSDEQIRTWAHLIQMGKHSSYDILPDKPFCHWMNRKSMSTGERSMTSATPNEAYPLNVTISPSKGVDLREWCVEQLFQLQLMEKGGISEAEYDEMQEYYFDYN